MNSCPYCGYDNRVGVLFCEECGHGLTELAEARPSTRQFDDVLDGVSPSHVSWGTADIGQVSSILVHIRDATDPLVVELADEVVIGRMDDTNPRQPDIDLTPFGALEKGVSRLHAEIHRGEDVLTLIDIGSSNGTYLNGQRLAPNQPRVLRDGDEVRLGKLVAHIYFK